MNLLRCCLVALALAGAFVALAQANAIEPEEQLLARPEPKSDQPARARFQLPKLFDFELYKQMFKRTYASAVEESIRRKYMLARAMRAFVSAIKYKLNQISHFSALNLFSDRMPVELDRMSNKFASRPHAVEKGDLTVQEVKAEGAKEEQPRQLSSDELVPDYDPDEIEQRLEQLRAGNLEAIREESGQIDQRDLEQIRLELERQQQQQHSRRKRELRRRRSHELSVDQLISTGDNVELDEATQAKVVELFESNNPDYKPPELHSMGLRDDKLVTIDWLEMHVTSEKKRKLERERQQRLAKRLNQLKKEKEREVAGEGQSTWDWVKNGVANFVSGGPRELIDKLSAWQRQQRQTGDSSAEEKEVRQLLKEQGVDVDADPDAPDEVFVDHRESNCMFLPRSQGNCGSCYAFAAVAMAEWLFCKQTGKLVAFSEQYIVDCGKPTTKQSGCDGGDYWRSANFIHNYGLELRSHYPYLAREQVCPYDEHTHPREMGFVRMELGTMLSIPIDILDENIHASPAFVHINAPNSFHEYGGGVWKGDDCVKDEHVHAVVVVGYGREDGLEYFLIRNSHSIGWGEQGHMKVWKRAPCFQEGYAVLYGFKSPRRMTVKPVQNFNNKKSDIKRLYGRNLIESLYSN